ncbi:TraB/GumN family protein [Flavobacterium sp.]|uniref:TraB/GumN family protein n=1 Tax=Flavobacterium sp. TaxID=239 RepID=UPI0032651ABA
MKNLFKSAITAIVILFSSATQSQTKSPKLENSLLWEVSGNGLEKPSYLYGTIHSICAADYFLSEKTKKAFDQSEKFILEINFSDPIEMADAQKMSMSSEPLSKKLTPEELTRLDSVLQKTTGLKIQQLDNFSLAAVTSVIGMKAFGCESLKSYESDFMDLAKKENKNIEGLETVKGQMTMLANAYTDSELINMLGDLSEKETSKMVEDYKAENLMNLYSDVADEKVMSAKAKKWVLDDRNKDWAKKIPEMMKKESLFVAVGVGHLAGESGVINLLRKSGYTVKSVMN